MKTKCKHVIGRYFHSNSEIFNFSYKSELDGFSEIWKYYNFCHNCGTRITKKLIKEYLKK